MSTNSASSTLDVMRPGFIETLFGKGRRIWSALAEGKAAADRYESLVGRGLTSGQAAQTVFREHFGKR